MSKNILIIGAGISGLTCLHYLKEKYKTRPGVSILLLEKNAYAGGTVQTHKEDGCTFEYGPNGFLDNKPQTLKLIEELGLSDHLIKSSDEFRTRYISLNNQLHVVPKDQSAFLKSNLFSLWDRGRIAMEAMVPKGSDPYESVDSFARRRGGDRIDDIIVDAVISGIYAGDSKRIVLRSAFPKVYDLEQTYGSLFKAVKEIKQKDPNAVIFPKPTLLSLKSGMSEIMDVLYQKYQKDIRLNTTVKNITKKDKGFTVNTSNESLAADHLIICTPSFIASELTSPIAQDISNELSRITYAPVAVVGLVYARKPQTDFPKGFGYLIPSKEKTEVMGVLFESNIFLNRCSPDQFIFRVMMGGMHHPDIANKSEEELIQMAKQNIHAHFQNLKTQNPEHIFIKVLTKAIPQYDKDLVQTNEWLDSNISGRPISFAANWRHGVSFNDCIENAFNTSQAIEL